MFFSFDGLDGAGKSTQMDLFCEHLAQQGLRVVRCVDPGSTALGERVRSLLLAERSLAIDGMAEMLLFMAARAQMVDEVIRPAIERGDVVVSDRYLLANVVYQGHAGGLDVELVWELGARVTRGVMPELTFVLDLPPAAASDRLARPLDRMEMRGAEYRQRLRDGYLAEAARRPDSIAVVDASPPIDAVQAEIRRLASRLLAIKRPGR